MGDVARPAPDGGAPRGSQKISGDCVIPVSYTHLGVVLLAGAKAGVPVFEYTPMQVKQAVVGYGRAEKKQVQQMTKMLLHLKEVPRPDDTADALALAICHAHASGSRLCTLSPR